MSSEPRRKAILDAAARLFGHYGHGKTTMADIARDAGVAVGSVYLDFPSKEAIVEELSTQTHESVLDAMRRSARHAGDAFPPRLHAVLASRVMAFFDRKGAGLHGHELLHCTAGGVQSATARFQEEERAFFRQLLEDARDGQEIETADARRTAALLQRALATLTPPWLFDLTPEEATRVTAEMGELFLNGLVIRATPRGASSAAKRRKR